MVPTTMHFLLFFLQSDIRSHNFTVKETLTIGNRKKIPFNRTYVVCTSKIIQVQCKVI